MRTTIGAIVIGVASLVWPVMGQGVALSIAVSPQVREAAKARLGITSDDPVCVGSEPPTDVLVCRTVDEQIAEWAAKVLRNELRQELEAMRASKAEAIEADIASIRVLDAESCAAINVTLKAKGLAPLKRCGGGL